MLAHEIFDTVLDFPADVALTQATLGLPASSGVCLFTDGENQPILLLYGANLRLLVRRRLSEEDTEVKTRRTRLRPVTARLWFRRTWSAFETQWRYFQIARRIYPETWADLFGHMQAWLLHLPEEQPAPLTLTNQIPSTGRCWGPFAEKTAARQYLEGIQNAFDLCRCRDHFNSPCEASACAYAQMGRCGAVAEGRFSPERYQGQIQEVIHFLDQPREFWRADSQQKMKSQAAQLQFEQAERTKMRMQQVDKLAGSSSRWAGPLERFAVLAGVAGPPLKVPHQRTLQPTLIPFILGPGWVWQGEPFTAEQIPTACQQWREHLSLGDRSAPRAPEELAWLARFLYGNGTREGLYLPCAQAWNSDHLARLVQEQFSHRAAARKKIAKPQLDTYSLGHEAQDDNQLNP